jgi:hypothetical protein
MKGCIPTEEELEKAVDCVRAASCLCGCDCLICELVLAKVGEVAHVKVVSQHRRCWTLPLLCLCLGRDS